MGMMGEMCQDAMDMMDDQSDNAGDDVYNSIMGEIGLGLESESVGRSVGLAQP